MCEANIKHRHKSRLGRLPSSSFSVIAISTVVLELLILSSLSQISAAGLAVNNNQQVRPELSIPSTVQAYVPITITNNANVSTLNGMPELLSINMSKYLGFLDHWAVNIGFYDHGWNPLYAWTESGAYCNLWAVGGCMQDIWVKMNSAISANGGTKTVYLAFLQPTNNSYASPGHYMGMAPQFTGTYGAFDYGANVFSTYTNFTSGLPTGWTSVSFSTDMSYTAQDGLSITGYSDSSGTWEQYQVHGPLIQNPPLILADTYVSSTNVTSAQSGQAEWDTGFETSVPSNTVANDADFTNANRYDWNASNWRILVDQNGKCVCPATTKSASSASGVISDYWNGPPALGPSTAILYGEQMNINEGATTLSVFTTPLLCCSSYEFLSLASKTSTTKTSVTYQWYRTRIAPPYNEMPTFSISPTVTVLRETMVWIGNGNTDGYVWGKAIDDLGGSNKSDFSIASTTYDGAIGYFLRSDGNLQYSGSNTEYILGHNWDITQVENQFGVQRLDLVEPLMPAVEEYNTSCTYTDEIENLLNSMTVQSEYIANAVGNATMYHYNGWQIDFEPAYGSKCNFYASTYQSKFLTFATNLATALHGYGLWLTLTSGSYQSDLLGEWLDFRDLTTKAHVDYIFNQDYISNYDGTGFGGNDCSNFIGNCFVPDEQWSISSTGADIPISQYASSLEAHACSSPPNGGDNCMARNTTNYFINANTEGMAVWSDYGYWLPTYDPLGFQGTSWQLELQSFETAG